MEFKTYFQAMSADERGAFALRCNTSAKHLQNIAYGYKQAGEKLAIDIDRESAGVIKCESLRPDVDFNYLRNSKAT